MVYDTLYNSDLEDIQEESIIYRNEKVKVYKEIYTKIIFRNVVDVAKVINKAELLFGSDLFMIVIIENEMIVIVANKEYFINTDDFSDDDYTLTNFSAYIDILISEADTQSSMLEIMIIAINSYNTGFKRKEKIILEKIKELSFFSLNTKQIEMYQSVLVYIIDRLLLNLYSGKDKDQSNRIERLNFPVILAFDPTEIPFYWLFIFILEFEQGFRKIMNLGTDNFRKYKKVPVDVRKNYYDIIDIIERYEKSDDKQYTKLYEGLKNLVMKKMRKAERHLKKLKE